MVGLVFALTLESTCHRVYLHPVGDVLGLLIVPSVWPGHRHLVHTAQPSWDSFTQHKPSGHGHQVRRPECPWAPVP